MERYIDRLDIEQLDSDLKRASKNVSNLIENAKNYSISSSEIENEELHYKKINIADLEQRIEHLNVVCKQIMKLKTTNASNRDMLLVRDDDAD